MKQSVQSAVDQVNSNANKEDEVWAWFSIGAELQRLGRHISSSKIFGKKLQTTAMKGLPASDRSDARWIFQNWKSVLEWIEARTGAAADDPFRALADLNHSHPSAIRRQVRAWLKDNTKPREIHQDLVLATQVAFETAWKRSSTNVELSQPSIDNNEGIDYLAESYDPFCGTTSARYHFGWSEIAEFIKDPIDNGGLVKSVEEWVVFEGEIGCGGELVADTDGRVHFCSDLEE